MANVIRKLLSHGDHAIDKSRTVQHDYDRAGFYYSAWCVCGAKLADKVPHYRKGGHCTSSVEDAFDEHARKVAVGDGD